MSLSRTQLPILCKMTEKNHHGGRPGFAVVTTWGVSRSDLQKIGCADFSIHCCQPFGKGTDVGVAVKPSKYTPASTVSLTSVNAMFVPTFVIKLSRDVVFGKKYPGNIWGLETHCGCALLVVVLVASLSTRTGSLPGTRTLGRRLRVILDQSTARVTRGV
jgi:hypothetical protein